MVLDVVLRSIEIALFLLLQLLEANVRQVVKKLMWLLLLTSLG